MLQGAPALFEFGGGAFSECTDASDQAVRGSRVRVQGLLGLALRAPDWDEDCLVVRPVLPGALRLSTAGCSGCVSC